jgi:class 3 adenylate cyclase/tetratricopeptide (TPR) repeat protein
VQIITELPHRIRESALEAIQAGAWADALRLAGSILAHDPLDAGAFEIISTARRALESAREDAAERRQLTILFADVAGSTALLARLGGERYRELMLALHEAAAKAVSTFGGRIGQYLGDGILAYFSYPEAHEDDAQRALYASLDILQWLDRASPQLAARFGSAPTLRVGVDTGRVVIGAAGAGQWTTADSVFGDAAHVAARLQALAPTNSIVISESTRRLVDRYFLVESLGEKALAGFSQPVPAHRVVRAYDVPRREVSGPVMCGREREIAELDDLWGAVRTGAQEELLIVGEAGVGKSRLVEHLANVALATGGRVIGIHCSAAFRHSVFHPLAAALRRVLVGTMRESLSDEELQETLLKLGVSAEIAERAIVPLSSLLDMRRVADVLPQQLRSGIFDVLLALLKQLAAASPLLLVVEDLHVADASTAEFLDRFRKIDREASLIVATIRRAPEYAADWRRTLGVAPLSEQAAHELVQRSAPALQQSKVEQVLKQAAGLPLFLIDIARGAAAGSSLLAEPSPSTALVTHRLDLLDEDCRSLVADLSVMGTACSYPVLVAVSELSTGRLERAVAQLLHSELLVACSTNQGSVFQFRHPLYQELAYDRQLATSCRRRHARCADALVEQHNRHEPAALPELIAHHLVQGDRTGESVPWWQRAGERAAATAAHAEAIAHHERGLRALAVLEPTQDSAQLELGLQLSYGASCSAVYGYADPRSMQAYARSSELGAGAPAATMLLPALWGIWAYKVVRGAHEEAVALTDRCLALADGALSGEIRAVAAAIVGAQYLFLGRFKDAEAELSLGVHAAGPMARLLPQDLAPASRAKLAVVKWVRGELLEAKRELNLALTAAAELQGRQAEFTRAYVYCYAAWFAQLTEDSSQALSFAQQAVAIASRHNFETWLGAGALHMAGALAELGEFSTSLPIFEQGLTGWRNAGAVLFLPYFLGRYARALTRLGRTAEALNALAEALSIAETCGESCYLAELHRLQAEALSSQGAEPSLVVAALERARRTATEQGATAFEQRARGASAPSAAQVSPSTL